MTTPDPTHATPVRAARVPASYIVLYSLLTVLALGLIGHGVYMVVDNRPGVHHLYQPSAHESTLPVIIANDRMLAKWDDRWRKSDLKEGIWELTIAIPFLYWAGKMAATCILFNRPSP